MALYLPSLRKPLIHNLMLFKVGEPKWNLDKRVWRKPGVDPIRNRVGAEIEFFGRTT
jgi:hypothetical protein